MHVHVRISYQQLYATIIYVYTLLVTKILCVYYVLSMIIIMEYMYVCSDVGEYLQA